MTLSKDYGFRITRKNRDCCRIKRQRQKFVITFGGHELRFSSCCVKIACILLCFGVTFPAIAEFSFSIGMQYDSFVDDRSPRSNGAEVSIPVELTYEREDVFIGFQSAYGYASVDPGFESSSNLSSITDSLLSVSFLIPNAPLFFILGLDVNLPTGSEQLHSNEKIAEAGENNDLFNIDNFGDGMNIGLHLGIIKEMPDLRWGLYGGYTLHGEFDPSHDVPTDDFDPGDETLLMTTLRWQTSPWMIVDTMLAYSHVSEDKIDDQKVFQEGDKFVLGGSMYVQYELLGIALSLQNTMQAKNDELVLNTLETETENSNRMVLLGELELSYEYSPQLTLQGYGEFRYYEESKRKNPLNGQPFEGKRTRYALGPGFSYIVDQHLACHGLAKYFVLHQKRDIMLDEDVTFQGVNLGIGMTYTF